jgi:hypothetical protein
LAATGKPPATSHGVPAEGGTAEDLVADGEPGDARADRVDHAGDLAARHGRELDRDELHRTGAQLPVQRVDPGGADRDAHLALAGRLDRTLDDPQHLRPAELRECHRTVLLRHGNSSLL